MLKLGAYLDLRTTGVLVQCGTVPVDVCEVYFYIASLCGP